MPSAFKTPWATISCCRRLPSWSSSISQAGWSCAAESALSSVAAYIFSQAAALFFFGKRIVVLFRQGVFPASDLDFFAISSPSRCASINVCPSRGTLFRLAQHFPFTMSRTAPRAALTNSSKPHNRIPRGFECLSLLSFNEAWLRSSAVRRSSISQSQPGLSRHADPLVRPQRIQSSYLLTRSISFFVESVRRAENCSQASHVVGSSHAAPMVAPQCEHQ